MKKAILLLLMGVTLFVSCKKDDNESPAVKTKAELIARTWEVESGSVGLLTGLLIPGYKKDGSVKIVDMSKFRLEFKSNGDLVQTGIEGVPTTGKWALSENDTKLTLTSPQLPAGDTWKIDNLTENNLDISRSIAGNSTAPGDLYWLTMIDSQVKAAGIPLSTKDGIRMEVKTIPVK